MPTRRSAFYCSQLALNGERADCRRWREEGGERVAAVDKIEDRHKPEDFIGHRNRDACGAIGKRGKILYKIRYYNKNHYEEIYSTKQTGNYLFALCKRYIFFLVQFV